MGFLRTLRRTPFLPASMRAFLGRRFREVVGLCLTVLGFALILSFLSYSPQDPSWNTAVHNQTIHNWMGAIGSYTTDLLLQTLGLSSYIFGLLSIGWGTRILSGRKLTQIHLRLILALIGITLSAGALTITPFSPPPFDGNAWGGIIGFIISARLIHLINIPPSLFWVLSLGLSFSAAILLFYAAGYTWREWGRGSVILYTLISKAGQRTQRAAISLGKPVGRLVMLSEDKAEFWGSATPVVPKTLKGNEVEEDDEEAEEKRIEIPAFLRDSKPKERKKRKVVKQPSLNLEEKRGSDEFELPSLSFLQAPPAGNRTEVSESALRQNAEMLENVLNDFGVKGEIVKVHPGPVVTLYELEPAPGVKASRVIGLSDDIARSMSAVSVRVAVVPGRNVIGIELPNPKRETVYLRELLNTETYKKTQATLPLVLGKDIGGVPITADLARMPHLLVAGTTGSGKSVAINTMILSLIYSLPPDKCRFIMVDPKMLELSVYEGIPHLLAPVVTEPKKAIVALKWTVREMEDRYRSMSKLGVRNIEGYNARLREARKNGEILTRRVQTGFDPDTGKPIMEDQPIDLTELPYIVVIVDEMADLMLVAGKDIEAAIQRLAQMARAAGIHLIMATQRPSVDVITGTIKANFPTRISFQVTSKIDSRTILSEQGAEQLLGQGDMLYMAGGGRITRVHGPFVSDKEVEAVVKYLRSQGEPAYLDSVTEDEEEGMLGEGGGDSGGSGDQLYDQAVALIARERKASTSFIQRHLRIGYNSAARIMEQMEKEGVVSTPNHAGRREVLIEER